MRGPFVACFLGEKNRKKKQPLLFDSPWKGKRVSVTLNLHTTSVNGGRKREKTLPPP